MPRKVLLMSEVDPGLDGSVGCGSERGLMK